MMATTMKIEGDITKMSKARLRQHEIKQKAAFEKYLVERADEIVTDHVYRLKEKKLVYLRLVCDPMAEYETKASTIDRVIENDYLYFGSSRNVTEK